MFGMPTTRCSFVLFTLAFVISCHGPMLKQGELVAAFKEVTFLGGTELEKMQQRKHFPRGEEYFRLCQPPSLHFLHLRARPPQAGLVDLAFRRAEEKAKRIGKDLNDMQLTYWHETYWFPLEPTLIVLGLIRDCDVLGVLDDDEDPYAKMKPKKY